MPEKLTKQEAMQNLMVVFQQGRIEMNGKPLTFQELAALIRSVQTLNTKEEKPEDKKEG